MSTKVTSESGDKNAKNKGDRCMRTVLEPPAQRLFFRGVMSPNSCASSLWS